MTMPAILWSCRDFRFDDNAAPSAACARGPVLPVFTLDAATRAQGAASRWRLGRVLVAFGAAGQVRAGQVRAGQVRAGQRITVLRGARQPICCPRWLPGSGRG